jgi:Arc/MetJ-type ribon-helix-helix transcriptional regulator
VTDKTSIVLEIEISQEEHQRLERLAQRRGYANMDAYIRALIQTDAEQHGEPMLFDDEEDIRIKFKRAFRDALHDDVLSEEQFWKEIRDDS